MADRRYKLPAWLKPLNRVVVALSRAGVPTPMTVLTVAGRKSGQPRSTPVTPFDHDGAEYVLGGFPGADWVKNVRAADTAELTRGRRRRTVKMVELAADDARPILRQWPRLVPTGVPMMIKAGVVTSDDPDEFAELAGRIALFRIEDL